MVILLADAFDPSLPDQIAKLGEVTTDLNRLAEADVIVVRSKTKCSAEFIDRAPKAKLIIRGGVGLDTIDCAYAEKKKIRVANTPAASSVSVAELAMTLMLGAYNHLVAGHNGMKEGKWLKNELKRRELYGKTLGLIGAGRIATALAQRAAAFEMKVIGFDAYVKSHPIIGLQPLNDVLSGADIISIHTPLTDETRGLLGADQLARTKRGVVVVNTARAEVVESRAMLQALTDGQVSCYATDVWSSDPPPSDDPLLSAPNMLMAPHIGASSKENLLRVGEEIVSIIKAFIG